MAEDVGSINHSKIGIHVPAYSFLPTAISPNVTPFNKGVKRTH